MGAMPVPPQSIETLAAAPPPSPWRWNGCWILTLNLPAEREREGQRGEMARGPWWPEGSARDVLELNVRADLQPVHVGGDDALLVLFDQQLELPQHRVVGDRGVGLDGVLALSVLALHQDAGAHREVEALALRQRKLEDLRVVVVVDHGRQLERREVRANQAARRLRLLPLRRRRGLGRLALRRALLLRLQLGELVRAGLHDGDEAPVLPWPAALAREVELEADVVDDLAVLGRQSRREGLLRLLRGNELADLRRELGCRRRVVAPTVRRRRGRRRHAS